jgi:hypothetical protein
MIRHGFQDGELVRWYPRHPSSHSMSVNVEEGALARVDHSLDPGTIFAANYLHIKWIGNNNLRGLINGGQADGGYHPIDFESVCPRRSRN